MAPLNALPAIAAVGLLIAFAIAVPSWLASIALKDASVADRVWPAFIAAPALFYVGWLGADARTTAMLAITLTWALRLGVFITARNWGHGEDRRYRDMRERNQPGFAWKSGYLVFGLQAFLGWIVGWPLMAAAAPAAAPWGVWDTFGTMLAVGGLLTETVADAQLARFRRDPTHRERVMDSGLWRYSRHPNYFGESCLWWGLGAMGVAAGGWSAAWCLVSPLMLTVLLLRVSGVALLEKDIGERRPGYSDYVARTSTFIPWPPKHKGHA